MRARLDALLERLTREVGPGALERTRRVELDREGRLVATLEDPAAWYLDHADGLRALLPAEDDLPLAPRCAEAELLSWRPGRRMVLRDGGWIWKGYRTRRSQAAVDRHRRVASVLDERAGMTTPPVVAHDHEHEALVLEDCPGVPLTIGSEQVDLFFRVGDGLRRLHAGCDLDGLARHGAAQELELLGRLAERQAGVVDAPAGWERSFDGLRMRDLSFEADVAPVALHRDLHDGQLSLEGDRLTVYDFDLLCQGHPTHDAANLIAHLELRLMQGRADASRSAAEACEAALLEGLDLSEGDSSRFALRFFQAATFLRLARVYALRPRWTALGEGLVELAELCQEEVPHAPA